MRISVDAMGGDAGPSVTVPAAAQVLQKHSEISLQLVGVRDLVEPEIARNGLASDSRVSLVHAPQVVEMDERPSSALRNKKESSMRVALNLVREGHADACVSAGNTGALMAIARFVLKTLPGIDRPAICAAMPGSARPTLVLDLGANVDSSSAELFRFAVMGAVLAEAVHGRREPAVALLNVGEEEIKGSDCVKQTALLLEKSSLNYVGFAEGNDIFAGKYDVIVCDGFVGNIALKASEGAARMLADIASEEFRRSWVSRLGALGALPTLRRLKERADPRRYNGASLLGLRNAVVKSHGSADAVSFANAVEVAIAEAAKDIPTQITDLLATVLEDG